MAVCNFPSGHNAQKTTRSSNRPEASRFNANSRNGLASSVSGYFSMREAMFRFSLKSSAVPNVISLAAISEKLPLYPSHLVRKNHPGESEMASFLARKSEPSAPIFCNMLSELAPPAPTGEPWNPVGAVRKQILALYGRGGITNSELP